MNVSYKEELKLRKDAFKRRNEIRIQKLEVRKQEKIAKKETQNELLKAKLSIAQSKNDPQKSIVAEKFTDKHDMYKAGSNGFYVSQDLRSEEFEAVEIDDNDDDYPDTMGFDIFGVNIDTNALADKAAKAAQDLAQQQINKLLAQAGGSTGSSSSTIVIPAASTTTQTNYVSQPMDAQTKMYLMAGGGLVGGLVLLKILKII